MNLQKIREEIEKTSLDVLLDKERLFVVNTPEPDGKKVNFKIVFSKQIVLGFVVEKIFYVFPEYWEGGSKFMFYFRREIDIVVHTYQLTKAVPLDLQGQEAVAIEKLNKLNEASKTEISQDAMSLLVDEAEAIAFDLQNAEATKVFNEMEERYRKMREGNSSQDSEKMEELRGILEELKDADAQKTKELADHATGLFTKMKDTEELKAIRVQIDTYVKKLQNPEMFKLHSPTGLSEKELKEKTNQEYLETVKKADSLFDRKKYDEAKELYEKAQNIKPEMRHPTKRLEAITKLKVK